MKPRNTTQIVLRTTSITLLVLLALFAWRTAPIWAHKPPSPAAGLPAGWTPSGVDLALNWSDVHANSGNLLQSHSGGPWLMVDDRLVLMTVSRDRNEDSPAIQTDAVNAFQVVTLPYKTKLLTAAVLDDKLWCFAMGPQDQLRGYAIATDTGAITATSDLLTSDVMQTPFGTEMAGHLLPMSHEDAAYVISSAPSNVESLPTGIRWSPQDGVQPATLPAISDFISPRPFYRQDGATLFAGRAHQYVVTGSGDTLQIATSGTKITPIFPTIDVHPAWEANLKIDPALLEPSILLRQTFLSMHPNAFPRKVAIADSIRSWQDAREWRDAVDAMLQQPLVPLAMPKPSLTDEQPICIGEPLSLYGPAGTGTALFGDTSDAIIEGQQRRWFAPLQLFRLNPTEALVVQCVPFDEPKHPRSQPILRLGLLSASSTQIQWLCYTRLPAEFGKEPMFRSQCAIYVAPDTWTLGLTSTHPAPGNKDVELLATSATFPAPAGVTVDGTGWLIANW